MKKFTIAIVLFVSIFIVGIQKTQALAVQDEVLYGENQIIKAPILKKTLKFEETGEEVAKLQNMLIETGYLILPAGPTGYYGPKTVAAVKLFQLENNIQSTGIVGPQTLTTINAFTTTPPSTTTSGAGTSTVATTPPNTTPTATGGTYVFTEKLGIGSKGPEVTKLQKFLAEKKLFEGPPTGYFGFQTKEALFKYQRINKVGEFGSIGTKTLSMLNTGKIEEVLDISQRGTPVASTSATQSGTAVAGTGSVTVTITPESALTKGAKWQISGKTETYTSGTTLSGLTPGAHTITFTPIMSHIKPKDISITVTADTNTAVSGVYVPAYDILEQTAFIKQWTDDIRYKLCLNPLVYPTPTLNTSEKTLQVTMPWKNNFPFTTFFKSSFTQSVTIPTGQLCGTSMPFTFQYSFNYKFSTFPPFGMGAVTYPSSYVEPDFTPGTVMPLLSNLTIDPAFTGSPGI